MASVTSTTVSDLEYDLVTTLSNLMQGREVLAKYAQDAEKAGDREAVEIFQTIRTTNEDLAGRLRNVLRRTMQ
jgi:hypothetical protein